MKATKQKTKIATKTTHNAMLKINGRVYVDYESVQYRNFRKSLNKELLIAGIDADALKGKTEWFTSNNVQQMLDVKKKFPKVYAVIMDKVVLKDLVMRIGSKGHISLEQ